MKSMLFSMCCEAPVAETLFGDEKIKICCDCKKYIPEDIAKKVVKLNNDYLKFCSLYDKMPYCFSSEYVNKEAIKATKLFVWNRSVNLWHLKSDFNDKNIFITPKLFNKINGCVNMYDEKDKRFKQLKENLATFQYSHNASNGEGMNDLFKHINDKDQLPNYGQITGEKGIKPVENLPFEKTKNYKRYLELADETIIRFYENYKNYVLCLKEHKIKKQTKKDYLNYLIKDYEIDEYGTDDEDNKQLQDVINGNY